MFSPISFRRRGEEWRREVMETVVELIGLGDFPQLHEWVLEEM